MAKSKSTLNLKNKENLQELLDKAWLNLDVLKAKNNVFLDNPERYKDEPHLRILEILKNPDYFYITCKYVFNIELLPFQALILQELWNKRFPMLIATRGAGKSFILGLYALLRCLLTPGSKVVIVGGGFRQAKIIFDYMETIANNAPVFQSLLNSEDGIRHGVDMWEYRIHESRAMAIPLGDGSRIRGLRATHILSDEFSSIPESIYENVVVGFGAVSSNPIDNVKRVAKEKFLQEGGLWTPDMEKHRTISKNQTVISGTAYYDFNHFAKYWKRYRDIIDSQGLPKRLVEIFSNEKGDVEIPKEFDWRDYSVIRIPVDMLPIGFMDATQVARSKATIHNGIYQMEYEAIFSTDSAGFYKRSLIERCVTTQPIYFPSGEVQFHADLRGRPGKEHIIGVDPAVGSANTDRETDNFSINIIELNEDHQRIVYAWSINKTTHAKMVRDKVVDEHDYYSYCAKKIRELRIRFPCRHISLDSQGGGISIMEALHDKDKIPEGELPIWPVILEDKEQPTDGEVGLHILEMVNFASSDWTSEANHGMRKDLEDRVLLFPYYDTVSIELAANKDKLKKLQYDTLEDCMMEIEELKDELASIVMTQTPSGRDKWDTPEIKLPGGKKGRQRKDRYSSLLMCNMAARTHIRTPPQKEYKAVGRFADGITGSENGPMYIGPSWFTENVNNNPSYGISVRKS